MKILIFGILILLLLYILFRPCDDFVESSNGSWFTARNKDTANLLESLKHLLENDLYNELDGIDKEKLKTSMKYITLMELIGDDPTILATNADKGREIAIRIYKNDNINYPYSLKCIMDSLLHEIAHTLTEEYGHGETWQRKNKELQDKFKEKFVDKLLEKTDFYEKISKDKTLIDCN